MIGFQPTRILAGFIFLSLIQLSNAQGCQPEPSANQKCVSVGSWTSLVNAISTAPAGGNLILCPFDINQGNNGPIYITKNINVICRDSKECKIDGAGPFVKVKGLFAQVLLQGIVFSNASKIAVHVTFDTPSIQTICKCYFLNNRGTNRGSGLRSEPKSNVKVKSCIFEGNQSTDLGGAIFNRGMMTIDDSVFKFNTGPGSAIGAAFDAKVEMSNNRFVGNRNGYMVVFHGNDYIDSSGNTVSNSDPCNGIYNLKTQQCVEFDDSPGADSEDTLAPSASTIEENNEAASCELVSTKDLPCTQIVGWFHFKNLIEKSSGRIVFCPFSIKKIPIYPAVMTKKVDIVCKEPKGCRISGAGRIIRIKGVNAEVYFQGFVFSDATTLALHVMKSKKPNKLCNCEFHGNNGSLQGVGIRTEKQTALDISSCVFRGNSSRSFGGSIHAKGVMTVSDSLFEGNRGKGGAISSNFPGQVKLSRNRFIENLEGPTLYFFGWGYQDLGENIANGNDSCNGILNVKAGNKCFPFEGSTPVMTPAPTTAPTPSPTPIPPANKITPRGGIGYFNYDPTDKEFGVGNRVERNGKFIYENMGWHRVKQNPEHERWKELWSIHRRDLFNRCNQQMKQSPIDLCDKDINAECREHHQTRTHSGNIAIDADEVTAQILPSKLRLKYYTNRIPAGGPYPPEGDFAFHWNGYAEVNHIDLKIPSEHTICGKRYPAEFSIFMLHPKRKETIIMSILMEFDENDEDNSHFQKAIDEWQKVYDEDASKCSRQRRKLMNEEERFLQRMQDYIQTGVDTEKFSVVDLDKDYFGSIDSTLYTTREDSPGTRRNDAHQESDENYENNHQKVEEPWDYMQRLIREEAQNNNLKHDGSKIREEVRNLVDKTPFGRGGWDPFHKSLETTIYHWGYWGSLTEPPCSAFFAWRVLVEPAKISRRQWNQLRYILFYHKNEKCEYTSVDYGESVARPTQSQGGRTLYKCQRSDYVSDREKAIMREKTGNPHWCC